MLTQPRLDPVTLRSRHNFVQASSMKIHVNRVPPEGLKEHATCDPRTLDMDRLDVHLIEPFEVDAIMTKTDHELVVTVEIHCPMRLSCARCLEEFDWRLTTHAIFSYKVQPSDVVDITEDVRQEIILAYPMIPVCQPDCKGLCSACGHNLNLGSCVHQLQQH